MPWIDCIQNSPEWFNLRIGKITGSCVSKIMAHADKGIWGNPAKDYAVKIAKEIVTGKREEETYSNEYMERGHTYEATAIKEYEAHTFTTVTNGGFFDCDWYGDSPDGLVGDNGCVEVKVVLEHIQRKRIDKGSFDTSYKWQICNHMFAGDRQWCDFVQYCPEMIGLSGMLYVYRVERNDVMIQNMYKRMNEFRELIATHVERINNE